MFAKVPQKVSEPTSDKVSVKPVPMIYPSVKRVPYIYQFENGFHEIDYYTWLEKLNSAEVKDFEARQNLFTYDYLKRCEITEEIKTTISAYAKTQHQSCPFQDPSSKKLFFFMMRENENFDAIYVQQKMTGTPQLLVSPLQLVSSLASHSAIRQLCVIRMFSVSPDGKILAYAYSLRDSSWLYIRFKEIKTGKDFPDLLRNVCHSDISWIRKSRHRGFRGIVYSCYPDPSDPVDHKVVFHELGTDQKDDLVYVEFPYDSGITAQAQISDCGELIFVTAQEQVETRSYTHFLFGDMRPTIKNDYQIRPQLHSLLEGDHLDVQYITNHNGNAYFRTNMRAPNFRICKTNLLHSEGMAGIWETVVPADKERLLDWAVCVNRDYLMICYLENARHFLELHKLKNGQLLHKYALPIGVITEYYGFRHCPNFFFTFSSLHTPDRIHYIKVPSKRGCCSLWPISHLTRAKVRYFPDSIHKDLEKLFRAQKYFVKQHFCFNMKDGVIVPIFLAYGKKFRRTGVSPCMMYAQGCFGIQLLPTFSIAKFTFLKHFRGLIAFVGVRGGGEYGSKWYLSGTQAHKQATYDDFIAATEYIIKRKYADPSKIIIEGELFGGNLAAVCMTQRPELYGAAIIHDGLMDLMRYHMFPESQAYLDDFGHPEAPHHCEKLANYSPLHNIITGPKMPSKPPAAMVVIGKSPSMSHQSNSFKFVSELQFTFASKSTEKNPFLLLSKTLDESSGTLGGRLLKIEERVCILSFLVLSLGLKFYEN